MIKNGRHAEQQLKAKIICRKSAQKAHLGCIEYRNYTTLYNVHLKNEEGGGGQEKFFLEITKCYLPGHVVSETV